MVHIVDEGSHFDAPVDVIWKYLLDQEDHARAHQSRRNMKVEPAGENLVHVSFEQNVQGNWVKVVNRITILAPLGSAIEMTEGPMKGSKWINYYTPMGNRTGVTVVGEFQSAMLPGAQLEPAVRKNLEDAFNEDSAAIREFAGKR